MSNEFTIEAVVDEKNRVHHQFQVDGKWYDATVFRIDGRGYDRLMSMVGEVATNQESDQLDLFGACNYGLEKDREGMCRKSR